jgi:hypothetical protein
LFKRRTRKPSLSSRARRRFEVRHLSKRDPGVPRPGSTQLADKNTQSEYAMPGAGGLQAGMR